MIKEINSIKFIHKGKEGIHDWVVGENIWRIKFDRFKENL